MKGVHQTKYEKKFTFKDFARYAKSILIPFLLFIFVIITINYFKNFGNVVISTMTSIMWGFGTITAIKIIPRRKEIIKETEIGIAGYCAMLILFHIISDFMARTSGAQLQATFSEAIPMSSSNTVTGFLQTAFWITSVMVPVSLLIKLGKEFVTFKRGNF